MFHHVARSVPGRLLWSRDLDGLALFNGIARAFPELLAVCLMPDHVHLLLPHADPDNRLHRVFAGYAHGLCVRRGLRGPLFAPRPPPQTIPDEKHLRRLVRYIHLELTGPEVVRFTGLTSVHRARLAATAPVRGGRLQDPPLAACVRAVADPRFLGLTVDDHRRDRAWGKYASRR
jgi:hypothetical protein